MKRNFITGYEIFCRKLGIRLFEKVGERNSLILLGLSVGVISGLAAIFLKKIVHWLHQLPPFLFEHYIILLFVLPIIGILLSVAIQKLLFGKDYYYKSLSPLIHALSINRPDMPFRKTYSHLLTSGISVGLGGSAGLEAPIVLTGAAVGTNLGKMFRLDSKWKVLLAACGSAAGISAIFDSPVAGVLFAAEVLLPELSVSSMIPILLASAASAVISKMFYGGHLFLLVSREWHLNAILFYCVLGLLSALVGVYMIKMNYLVSAWIKNFLKNEWMRILGGGLAVAILIALFPPLFGEGYSSVEMLFAGNSSAVIKDTMFESTLTGSGWLLVLFCLATLLLKVIATVFTIQSGGDGGIFAPSMFVGAFTGFVFSRIMNLSGLISLNEPNFIAAGMCGVFTAVMRAPLTGIFLIAEITGGYMLFIPLMIVAAVAFFIARYFEPYSVYTRALAEKNMLFNEDKDQAILNRIEVKSVLESDFASIREHDSFRKLVQIVVNSKQNIFPVLDDSEKLIGIVALDNIRSLLLDTNLYDMLLVFDIMDEPLPKLESDDSIAKAITYFEMFNLWNIPVVYKDGKYAGFISKNGVFSQYRAMVKDLQYPC